MKCIPKLCCNSSKIVSASFNYYLAKANSPSKYLIYPIAAKQIPIPKLQPNSLNLIYAS